MKNLWAYSTCFLALCTIGSISPCLLAGSVSVHAENPTWLKYDALRNATLVQYDWGLVGRAAVDTYYLFYAISGGSSTHAVYICTNNTDNRGYAVNGIFAQYILSEHGPFADGYGGYGGLFAWNDTSKAWAPLLIADREIKSNVYQSSNGEVEVASGQGRVALAALQNPSKIYLVLEALESTKIRIPHNGFSYFDVRKRLGGAFVVQKPMADISHPSSDYPVEPQEWVVNRSQSVKATLLLRNYGGTPISVSSHLDLPPNISVTNGETDANVTVQPSESVNSTAVINGYDFGIYELHLWLYYDGASQTELVQKMAVVPRIEAAMEAPEVANYYQTSRLNVTVKNVDDSSADVELVPTSGIIGAQFAFTINGLSEIDFHPFVNIEGEYLEYKVTFQNLTVAKCTASLDVAYPQGQILYVLLNSTWYDWNYVEFDGDTVYDIRVFLKNTANFSFRIELNLLVPKGTWQTTPIGNSEYFAVDAPDMSVFLDPGHNASLDFRLRAFGANKTETYREVILQATSGDYSIDMESIKFKFVPLTEPWYTTILKPEIILVSTLTFTVGFLLAAGVFTWRLRRQKTKTIVSHALLTINPRFSQVVRGVGFEPTNLYRIGASGLRL